MVCCITFSIDKKNINEIVGYLAMFNQYIYNSKAFIHNSYGQLNSKFY